jgi:hypothetical protein
MKTTKYVGVQCATLLTLSRASQQKGMALHQSQLDEASLAVHHTANLAARFANNDNGWSNHRNDIVKLSSRTPFLEIIVKVITNNRDTILLLSSTTLCVAFQAFVRPLRARTARQAPSGTPKF